MIFVVWLVRHVASHAAKTRAAADGVRSYGELSGRLVLVDDKTAAELKSGKMMTDEGGETLAHVLNDDKKISGVARLREVGGLASSAAAVTNAMSAMAMQAQLDRIERKLSEAAVEIDKANRELKRAWQAKARGAQEVLGEVYRPANAAGEAAARRGRAAEHAVEHTFATL